MSMGEEGQGNSFLKIINVLTKKKRIKTLENSYNLALINAFHKSHHRFGLYHISFELSDN